MFSFSYWNISHTEKDEEVICPFNWNLNLIVSVVMSLWTSLEPITGMITNFPWSYWSLTMFSSSSLTASSEPEIGQSQPGKDHPGECSAIVKCHLIDLKKVQSSIEVMGIHLPLWVTVLQGVSHHGYNMEMKSSIPIPTVEVRLHCPGNLQKLKWAPRDVYMKMFY